jgi:N-acetylmuramoyl-L-alanine amidase
MADEFEVIEVEVNGEIVEQQIPAGWTDDQVLDFVAEQDYETILFEMKEDEQLAVEDKVDLEDVEWMSRAGWGEARSEGREGMAAAMHTMWNRAVEKGVPVKDIIQQNKQYSALNDGDPNQTKLLSVDESDEQFAIAKEVARAIASGRHVDPTGGATHYHKKDETAFWSEDDKHTVTIGQHKFYAGIPWSFKKSDRGFQISTVSDPATAAADETLSVLESLDNSKERTGMGVDR